jgi:hypothetical protein
MEMARTTRSYAWQVSAQDVWVARSGQFIWIRMETRQEYKDILFQSLSEVHRWDARPLDRLICSIYP